MRVRWTYDGGMEVVDKDDTRPITDEARAAVLAWVARDNAAAGEAAERNHGPAERETAEPGRRRAEPPFDLRVGQHLDPQQPAGKAPRPGDHLGKSPADRIETRMEPSGRGDGE